MIAKDKAIKDAQGQIENLQKYIQVLKELPDPPEGCTLFVSDYGRAFVEIPYNFETYRRYRQRLAEVGWVATIVYNVENGKRYTDMISDDGQRLSLVLNPEMEGATCELVKIGEEVKPVYRVQCAQIAA